MNSPIWSVMIPTFNAGKYLAQTLQSVLKQDYDHNAIEIVVVDNCSTDNTEDIVKSVGGGRVLWRQNSTNIGMIANFNKCIELAKGEIIHILNADDLVNQGYYSVLGSLFEKYPNIGLVSCAIEVIDDDGDFLHKLPLCKSLSEPTLKISEMLYDNLLRTPAVAVRNSVYKRIGGFDSSFSFAFDWEMWVRVIATSGGIQTEDYLCQYRQHASSETARVAATSKEILDRIQVMEKFNISGYAEDKKGYKNLIKNTAFHQYNNFPEGELTKANIIKYIYMKNSSIVDKMRDLYLNRLIKLLKD